MEAFLGAGDNCAPIEFTKAFPYRKHRPFLFPRHAFFYALAIIFLHVELTPVFGSVVSSLLADSQFRLVRSAARIVCMCCSCVGLVWVDMTPCPGRCFPPFPYNLRAVREKYLACSVVLRVSKVVDRLICTRTPACRGFCVCSLCCPECVLCITLSTVLCCSCSSGGVDSAHPKICVSCVIFRKYVCRVLFFFLQRRQCISFKI